MRKSKLDKYYLTYQTENTNLYFVYAIRICKVPEMTKEYKKLRTWLYSGIVKSCGYCTEKYYQENKHEFINNYKNLI